MTATLFFLAAIAAADPARFRLAVHASGVAQPSAVLGGAGIALVVTVGAALAGESVINWLSVSPESWRIAAGIVAGFTGVRRLVGGPPVAEPTLGSVPAAVIPAAFPILVTPVVLMLAVTGGVDLGFGNVVTGFGAALILGAAAAALVPDDGESRLWLAGSRFLAAILVLVAVVSIISGIADI